MMVGRSVDSLPEATRASSARTVLRSPATRHPTEFDDIGFELAPGRDPRLLRPGRRRPLRGHAGAVRHHPAVAGVVDARRQRRGRIRSPADAIAPASSMCRRTAAARASCCGMPIFQNVTLPSLASTSRHGFLRLAEEFALARRLYRAARPARRGARPGPSARSRAATSRRW